ncbi:conserved hypothetical protein [Pseudomonas sp. 8Z]|nr:conserved hypothetical protein [Pseudomonas sp. 8Z]
MGAPIMPHGCVFARDQDGLSGVETARVPRVITYEESYMATNRSRRLRKKLCVDEFQELGFELTLNFKADLSDQVIDSFIDQFLDDAIAGNGLDYVGGEDYGLVCLAKRGSVSEEQRSAVEAWLKGRDELEGYEISPLLDVWYPGNPINQA